MSTDQIVTEETAYDIGAWKKPVCQHDSIETAIADGIGRDGIHQIELAKGRTLDLCVQDLSLLQANDQDRVILVGLNGAVAGRNGKKAPFFSGLGIARSLRLPIIAVSDPTLALDPDLPLAWYAGSEDVPDLSHRLARVLDGLAQRHHARLIVFGGSGGGYAGLLLATLLECRATVLVWNPQTAIADYVPEFVEKYVEVAFPSLGKVLSRVRAEDTGKPGRLLRDVLDIARVIHDVRDVKLPSQIEILYLQNRSDWHVAHHAAPYLSGRSWNRVGQAAFMEKKNNQIGLFFGQWGEGHAAPPKSCLEAVLRELAAGEPVAKILRVLDDDPVGVGDEPLRFNWLVENSGLKLEASARVVSGQVHVTCFLSPERTEMKGVTYAFYLLVDGVRQAIRWYEPCPDVYFDLPNAAKKLEVITFARLHFGVQMSVRIPVWAESSATILIPENDEDRNVEHVLLDYRENRASSGQEALRFAEILVKHVINLPEVRPDWRLFTLDSEIESIFSGNVVLKSGTRLPVGPGFSIDWRVTFQEKVASNVLWLYSLEYVGTLLSGYEKTDEERYLEAAVGVVQDFLDFFETSAENRLLVLTHRQGLSSQDHAMANRTNVFVKMLHILANLGKKAELASRIACCLHAHGLFLMDDDNYSHTNHGVMADIALAQLGVALGTSSVQGAQFVSKATIRLTEAIQRAFDRDGFTDENTIGYHRFNISLYEGVVTWFAKWHLDESFARVACPILERANAALRFAVWPDGSVPPIGDSPVYPKAAQSINQSRLFSDSHFGVIKSDDLYVSLICGWRGTGHKHVDDTSMTVRYLDNNIVVDAGSFSYDKKNLYRQCLHSSFGHSGIFLTAMDGFSPSEYLSLGPAAKIKEWVEGPTGVHAIAEVQFSKWGATLQRRIEVVWPNRVLVSDSVRIAEGFPPMTARQSWLLGEGMQAGTSMEEGGSEYCTFDNGSVCATFRFVNHGNPGWTESHFGVTHPLVRGWCSETFGQISPALEWSRYQTGMRMEFGVEMVLARSLATIGTDRRIGEIKGF